MKSVFITPDQVLANGDLLRGRSVGIVLFTGAPFDEKKVAKVLGSRGAKFLGVSPAVSLSSQGKSSLPVQISTAERSARLHSVCADATGTFPAYRLATEPGRLYWRRESRQSVEEITDNVLKIAKKNLPTETVFEISQNEISNPIVLGGFMGYLEWLASKERVSGGIQVWLNKWAAIAPGVVMGAVKSLAEKGVTASISEFGVLAPSPPHPSHPDLLFDWEEWRMRRVVAWLLQSGLGEEDAPYWGPLSQYSHGPYVHAPFPTLGDFDAFYLACYRRVAATGGPVGVGADFKHIVATGAGESKEKRPKG